jgi:hypothetical protein
MDAKLEIPPSPSSTRRRRGQALAEFALTLPILLLLLFGIIEFARIFQAWVTLQNAARTAARYAITGQVEAENRENRRYLRLQCRQHCGPRRGKYPRPLCLTATIANCTRLSAHFTPDGYQDYESVCANHWDGLDCEPAVKITRV